MLFFFFFSSRRRHTRFDCDWSSDVCSSDLPPGGTTEIDVGGNATANGSSSPHNVGGRTVAGGRDCKKKDNSNLMPMGAVGSTGIVKTKGRPNVFTPGGGLAAYQQKPEPTTSSRP